MSFSTQVVLSFSAIFPEETPNQPKEYLQGISRETLMNLGCFFLGFKNYGSQYEDPVDFMKMFFSGNNTDLLERSKENIKTYLNTNGYHTETATIPYALSSLELFENAFNLPESVQTKTKRQSEIDIFKFYLLLNQNLMSKRSQIIAQVEKHFHGQKKIAANLLFYQFNSFDLTNYHFDKLFSTQFLRALMFFDFLNQREDCNLLLREFYSYFGVEDYKDYLKRILPLAFGVIKGDLEAHTDIVLDEQATQEDIDFLDKLAVDNLVLLDDFDFKSIRANPIYKVSERTYRIISPPFAIELIYNGLYWKFREVYDQMPKTRKPKDLYSLKTYEFSEKFVLNKILGEYFGNRYIQKTGKELDRNYEGAPDYYVRNSNSIILFESKDIMINAAVKESVDLLEIQQALAEKLYKKADGTPKAVMQLIRSITKILTNQQKFDEDYSADDVIISPVIVVHYRMFNNAGLNKFINFWFQEELHLLKEKGLKISNVKPLVIIDIDTLIFNKDVFADRILELENCLFEYQADYVGFDGNGRFFTSKYYHDKAFKESFLPFDHYLDNKIDKMGLRKTPREIKENGFKIFD